MISARWQSRRSTNCIKSSAQSFESLPRTKKCHYGIQVGDHKETLVESKTKEDSFLKRQAYVQMTVLPPVIMATDQKTPYGLLQFHLTLVLPLELSPRI